MTASADQPAAEPSAAGASETAAPEWKPEPRQWTWKDLFTAPMLAFKPKCMAVSALTLLLLGGLWWVYADLVRPELVQTGAGQWWLPFVQAGFALAGLVIFSLGAVLVSVFLKADLLDDEFLSMKEAVAQYAPRVLPAVLVPVFLALLAAGVFAALIWLPMLAGSIPYAGPALYALLYPLGFFAGIFFILVCIAVCLAVFVFPAIVAVRRHGWFDNVVDTIEAVGTKPHVLVGSILLSVVLVLVAYGIGFGGMGVLKDLAGSRYLPGDALQQTELRASQMQDDALRHFDPIDATFGSSPRPWRYYQPETRDQYLHWGPGLVVGFWQILFGALLLGYCLNLVLSGGILTYLVVREDDYWDDEDLEDLDKLAKELEEEAKREAEQAAAGRPAAAAAAPAAGATEAPPA